MKAGNLETGLFYGDLKTLKIICENLKPESRPRRNPSVRNS